MRREGLPILATYVLAWVVVTGPMTYAILVLSARECAYRSGYGVAAATAAVAVLVLGGRSILVSRWWPWKLVAWFALLVPPAIGLLIGFGCNVLWW